MKNLYKCTQFVNNNYDTYDAFITCAKSAEEARFTYPRSSNSPDLKEFIYWDSFSQQWIELWENGYWVCDSTYGEWCSPDDVKVEFVGSSPTSMRKGILLASYNAG